MKPLQKAKRSDSSARVAVAPPAAPPLSHRLLIVAIMAGVLMAAFAFVILVRVA
jgi:hypothetical protein